MRPNRATLSYAESSEDEYDYLGSSYSQGTDFADPQELLDYDSDEEVNLK
jgi:hypothetical protein